MTSFESFETYVRSRQEALLRSARRLVPDPTDAQDLLQTALVRTYGKWDGIEDKSLADAYLRRVMINTRTEWWRSRRLQELPTDTLPEVASEEDRFGQYADRALLVDVLSVLAPKQRSVVVLRHWEQMSTEETAEALGMSTGTVKSTLHRALARLREELESRELCEQSAERGRGPTGGPRPGVPRTRAAAPRTTAPRTTAPRTTAPGAAAPGASAPRAGAPRAGGRRPERNPAACAV
ncbi:SigE family RNA polymerase sigma factor [Streptomyces sp. JHD 1]|nr:SigE family RNA polymerase sigma factor [Streptomyces sp. JHD 1]MCX2970718.1 SigE family RNA polymerase sigma factor [Streptomyces sp. JHD 1]